MSAVELGWHRLPEVHGFQKGVLTARHSVARIVFQHSQGQPIIESQNNVGRTHIFRRHSEVRGFHHHGPRFTRRQRAGHPTSEVRLHKNKNKKLTAIELGWHRLPEVRGFRKDGLSAKESITRIVFRHVKESQSLRVRRKLAALTFSPNTAKSEPFANVDHASQGVKGRDIETQKSACTPNVSGSDPAKA